MCVQIIFLFSFNFFSTANEREFPTYNAKESNRFFQLRNFQMNLAWCCVMWNFNLPLRNLSPLFVLMANRPIVKLFLTLCMIAVAHFRDTSIPLMVSIFLYFFLFSSLLWFWYTNNSRIEEKKIGFNFYHVTNIILLFCQVLLLLFMLRKER